MIKTTVIATILFLVYGLVYGQAGLTLDHKTEYRVCGPAKRDSAGHIVRNQSVLTAHQKLHPCPSTGLQTGACPGWAQDHDIPLVKDGCDAVFNLSWMPIDTTERRGIKSCAKASGVLCKDRYEQQIYSNPIVVVK